ncbi:MAG: HAMP domain-containing histidine kinase, partial [Bacteroidia bacterium]|nr:HAMP domain-containing histidine kinase [Bacteroidia bacterium]
GVGIADDLQARMFEPFFTTKESGTGTGLGLYLSKSIINEHRGTLTFQSQPGMGTEFIITLPIKNS